MDKNFIVDNAVGIDVDGYIYDLHNFYDFRELRVDIVSKTVSLLFSANAQTQTDQQIDATLLINFKEVTYFELSPNFVNELTCDLEEIGYKNVDDKDVNWLINETKSTASDHLLFRFANDGFIRIHAKVAYCEVNSNRLT